LLKRFKDGIRATGNRACFSNSLRGRRGRMSRLRRARPSRRPWSQLVVPGQPVKVPQAVGASLRLDAAVLARGDDAGQTAAELRVSVPGARAGDGSLSLARLRATGPSGVVAQVRALLSCVEGMELSSVGQPLWVVGRLEGESTPAGLRPLLEGPAAAGPPREPTAPRPKAQEAPRPRSDDEYLTWLEEYLRTKGRTPLRKLGAAVRRPRHVRPGRLKAMLLKHRKRFIVDLQGFADINHAKRWRWQAQPAVTRQRVGGTKEEEC